jgi:hypothetical protein
VADRWFDVSNCCGCGGTEANSVFVNQVGYELGGPKTAVIAANFAASGMNSASDC